MIHQRMPIRPFALAAALAVTSAVPVFSCAVGARADGLQTHSPQPHLAAGVSLIAYVCPGGISVMNPDGTNQHLIPGTSGGNEPNISRDGTKVVFVEGLDIYRIAVDGTGLTEVSTPGPAYFDEFPAWSPDGSEIAYSDGSSAGGSGSGAVSIAVMNADGSGNHVLTNQGFVSDTWDESPAWSPSGSQIAYNHFIGDNDLVGIYVMNADGSGQSLLVPNGDNPAWSPSGTQLAFDESMSQTSPTYSLFVISATGGTPDKVTGPGVFAQQPAWSPDGTMLAFASGGQPLEIALLNLATSVVSTLTSSPYGMNNRYPSWSGYPRSAGSNCTTGYDLVASDGGIFNFGIAPFFGSAGALPLNRPVVGMATTRDEGGYYLVASDGGIFTYGDAQFRGSMGGAPLNQPIVGMAVTPDGGGYYLVARDGGLFAFGDAHFQGSMGGKALNQPIVGMAVDPATGGYWEVAADGGIFGFGAPFFGSTGAIHLNKPIVGMASTTHGLGYLFVASDGGIFNYGDAPFAGSMGGQPLNKPVVGVAIDPVTDGYREVAADGGIFSFRGSQFCGSTGGIHLNRPIVGIATAG